MRRWVLGILVASMFVTCYSTMSSELAVLRRIYAGLKKDYIVALASKPALSSFLWKKKKGELQQRPEYFMYLVQPIERSNSNLVQGWIENIKMLMNMNNA